MPAFKVEPFNEKEETFNMDGWKTALDFTEKGKKKGISAKKMLEAMKKFEKQYG